MVLGGRVRPQNCLAGALPKGGYLDLPVGWHDCSTCSSFCLAGTMPKAFLTEPHGPGWCFVGGCVLKTAWQEHYHSLPIDLPLADMIAARVLLSDWQAPCQRHS